MADVTPTTAPVTPLPVAADDPGAVPVADKKPAPPRGFDPGKRCYTFKLGTWGALNPPDTDDEASQSGPVGTSGMSVYTEVLVPWADTEKQGISDGNGFVADGTLSLPFTLIDGTKESFNGEVGVRAYGFEAWVGGKYNSSYSKPEGLDGEWAKSPTFTVRGAYRWFGPTIDMDLPLVNLTAGLEGPKFGNYIVDTFNTFNVAGAINTEIGSGSARNPEVGPPMFLQLDASGSFTRSDSEWFFAAAQPDQTLSLAHTLHFGSAVYFTLNPNMSRPKPHNVLSFAATYDRGWDVNQAPAVEVNPDLKTQYAQDELTPDTDNYSVALTLSHKGKVETVIKAPVSGDETKTTRDQSIREMIKDGAVSYVSLGYTNNTSRYLGDWLTNNGASADTDLSGILATRTPVDETTSALTASFGGTAFTPSFPVLGNKAKVSFKPEFAATYDLTPDQEQRLTFAAKLTVQFKNKGTF